MNRKSIVINQLTSDVQELKEKVQNLENFLKDEEFTNRSGLEIKNSIIENLQQNVSLLTKDNSGLIESMRQKGVENCNRVGQIPTLSYLSFIVFLLYSLKSV